jgi:hypothetical protein
MATKTSASIIQEIREELKQKQGLTIKSGAYARTFTYDDRIPSTIDILETLKEFEANKKESQKIIHAHWNDEMKEMGFTYIGGGNTYNWNANISHDLDWNHYEKNERSYYIVKVHTGIDIRSGYTSEFVVSFNNQEEFYEVIDLHETSYIESANGRGFFVTVRPLSEEITAIDIESEEEFYFYDIDDLETATKKEEAKK